MAQPSNPVIGTVVPELASIIQLVEAANNQAPGTLMALGLSGPDVAAAQARVDDLVTWCLLGVVGHLAATYGTAELAQALCKLGRQFDAHPPGGASRPASATIREVAWNGGTAWETTLAGGVKATYDTLPLAVSAVARAGCLVGRIEGATR